MSSNEKIDPCPSPEHLDISMKEKGDALSINEVIALLDSIIYSKNPPFPLPQSIHANEKLSEIILDLIVIRNFIFSIANGDLSARLNMKGYIGGALKMLQANLRHLTWQTQMIASGDFSQRVEFMGEFSIAFNEMVVKLEETLKTLKQREIALTESNLALTHEIEARKAMEKSLRESEEKYRNLAQTDPLTGVFNRRHFFQLAQTEIHRAFRYKQPLSLMMLDIDYFKKVNDTYGHAVGDKVLKETAKTAGTCIRTIDILARFGGEEFVILLPDTDIEGALVVAERIRERIQENPVEVQGQSIIKVTASIGLSSSHITAPDISVLEGIINRADEALYEAKKGGRNRVCKS